MAKKKPTTAAAAMAATPKRERPQPTPPKPAWLRTPSEYAEEIQVPGDLLPALASNRPEMLKLVRPRALTADEHKTYLELIRIAMETNYALQCRLRQMEERIVFILEEARDATAKRLQAAIAANHEGTEVFKRAIEKLARFQTKEDQEGPKDE